MKLIPTQFDGVGEVSGFTFTQLHRSDKAFIYKVESKEDQSVHYEVFKRKVSKAGQMTIGGKTINCEETETYPRSTRFGISAWCISDYQRAIDRYNTISGTTAVV